MTSWRPRPSPAGSPSRAGRGVVVGLVGGGGAVVAHQLAGGRPSLSNALVVTALSMVAGIVLARRRVGLLPALGLAAIAQATSHLLMTGSAGHDQMNHMAPGHQAALANSSLGGLSMLTAHVVVALLTAATIRGADQVLLDLVRVLVSRFVPRTLLGRVPLPPSPRSRLPGTHLIPTRVRAASTPQTRRGPPAAVRLSLPTS